LKVGEPLANVRGILTGSPQERENHNGSHS
jgi:hypothetical protein